MKKTETITITTGSDGRIWIEPPWHPPFTQELKDRISWKEREWARPYWKVQAHLLEVVREIARTFAEQEEWQFLDATATSPQELAAQLQQQASLDLERHVEAVLAVLPKLPRRSLALVAWDEAALELELRAFLGEELFGELREAALKTYKPTVLAPALQRKRSYAFTFRLAADPRIIRALAEMAGAVKEGLSFTDVENLRVRDLHLLKVFDNGRIVHFATESGQVWVGIAYREVAIESWEMSGREWEIALTERDTYIIFQREKHVRALLGEPAQVFFAPAVGFAVAPPDRPSHVAGFLREAHLEDWFVEWATDLVTLGDVRPNVMAMGPRWHDHDWDHPADVLLAHLAHSTRPGMKELRRLLSWSPDFIAERRTFVQQLKWQAVQLTLAQMRGQAAELARPLLEKQTVADLLQLGESYSVVLKKSARKGDLVAQLAANRQLAEDLIGLTKRLAREKQLGGEQHDE